MNKDITRRDFLKLASLELAAALAPPELTNFDTRTFVERPELLRKPFDFKVLPVTPKEAMLAKPNTEGSGQRCVHLENEFAYIGNTTSGTFSVNLETGRVRELYPIEHGIARDMTRLADSKWLVIFADNAVVTTDGVDIHTHDRPLTVRENYAVDILPQCVTFASDDILIAGGVNGICRFKFDKIFGNLTNLDRPERKPVVTSDGGFLPDDFYIGANNSIRSIAKTTLDNTLLAGGWENHTTDYRLSLKGKGIYFSTDLGKTWAVDKRFAEIGTMPINQIMTHSITTQSGEKQDLVIITGEDRARLTTRANPSAILMHMYLVKKDGYYRKLTSTEIGYSALSKIKVFAPTKGMAIDPTNNLLFASELDGGVYMTNLDAIGSGEPLSWSCVSNELSHDPPRDSMMVGVANGRLLVGRIDYTRHHQPLDPIIANIPRVKPGLMHRQ